MLKVIAIIISVLIIWVGFPHLKQGEWLAPNPVPPNSWTLQYAPSDYAQASATPPEGYGFRRFDFWNYPSIEGRSATKDDFRLRY